MAARKFVNLDFRSATVGTMTADGTGAGAGSALPTSAANQVDVASFMGTPLYFTQFGGIDTFQFPVGANGITMPSNGASHGTIIETALANAPAAPTCFTVGTDPAFYTQISFLCSTVANISFVGVGFRSAQSIHSPASDWTVANLALGNALPYGDISFAGYESTAAHTIFKTNATVGSDVATADAAIGNGSLVTLRVNVSAARVATATFNGGASRALGTVTNGTVLCPYFVAICSAGGAMGCSAQNFQWGLQ
jgi:hypothetical protein